MNTKRKFELLLLIYFLFPFYALAQERYILKGQISASQGVAYLRYNTDAGLRSDSSVVKDGKFMFTAPYSDITEAFLSVRLQPNITSQVKLYLEPRTINIVSPTNLLKDARVSGSKVNDDYAELNNLLKPVTNKGDSLMKIWRSKTKQEVMDTAFRHSFMAQQVALEVEARKIKSHFASGRRDSYIGLVAYLETGAMDLVRNFNDFVKNFNSFSVKVRSTNLGKGIQEQIDGFEKTKVGLSAMDFSQKDKDGKPVKLSDFRGKYVLVDFWASWCVPCRHETPALVKAYKKYNQNNFTILSISLDKAKDRASWLKAIESDHMEWTNVSDLKFWRNEAAILYGIKSIPANFLIDPKGQIIAKDLRGEQLEEKLAEIFH